MNQLRHHIVFLLLLLGGAPLAAQHLNARLEADTSRLLIGEPVGVHLTVAHPSGLQLRLPQLSDTLGKMEVLWKSAVDTAADGSVMQLRQHFRLTAFEPGTYQLPELPLYFTDEAGNERVTYTNALSLEVQTVAVDTSQVFRDIKPPLEAPYTTREILSWVLAGILVLALLGLLIWRLRKKPQQPQPQPVRKKAVVPPYQVAMERLQKLQEAGLWQKGEVKGFYVELTDILRTYIEDQFHLPALESTSEEIMQELESLSLQPALRSDMRQLLTLADFVKFAKMKPGPEENIKSMDIAKRFIQQTKPTAGPATAEQTAAANVPAADTGSQAP
ncbi:MAG: hypothetical protein D6730_04310 [Bacteroidetes bacterium]|nr:MAG: hypothetical protein D6730_04310 [Bacteroidota bacterium]